MTTTLNSLTPPPVGAMFLIGVDSGSWRLYQSLVSSVFLVTSGQHSIKSSANLSQLLTMQFSVQLEEGVAVALPEMALSQLSPHLRVCGVEERTLSRLCTTGLQVDDSSFME